MKNKFFSAGIFRDYFSQLKIVGVIGTALYTLFSVFTVIMLNISSGPSDYTDGVVFYIGYHQIFLWQMFVPVLFVPLLMLAAFNFLSKRNSSDFYHSLPIRRLAMYTGIIAAVLLWVFFITVVPAFSIWILCLALKYVEISFAALAVGLLNTLVSCLFMAGVFALGINLSGTLFTNIVVSLIILIVPRLIIMMFAINSDALVKNSPDVMYYSIKNLLLNGNPITKIFSLNAYYYVGFAEFGTYAWNGIAAGLIEAFPYLIMGGVLFVRRKSETASMPSINRGIQAVIRHMLALVVSMEASVFLILLIRGREQTYAAFMTVFLYVLSVVVYFLYELVTTRKWKAVAKCARQLPVFAGLTVAVLLGFAVYSHAENSYRINADKAEIEIQNINVYYGSIDRAIEKKCPIKISDPDAKKYIAGLYNNDADSPDDSLKNSIGHIVLYVREGAFLRHRKLELGKDGLYGVLKCILNDGMIGTDGFMPDYDSASYKEIYTEYGVTEENFPAGVVEKIYKTLSDELSDWDAFLKVMLSETQTELGSFAILNNNDGLTEIPISIATPRTFKLFSDAIQDYCSPVSVCEMLEKYNSADKEDSYMETFLAAVPQNGEWGSCTYYGPEVMDDVFAELDEILSGYSPKGDISGNNVFMVRICLCQNGQFYEKMAFGVYNLSYSDLLRAEEILKKLQEL